MKSRVWGTLGSIRFGGIVYVAFPRLLRAPLPRLLLLPLYAEETFGFLFTDKNNRTPRGAIIRTYGYSYWSASNVSTPPPPGDRENGECETPGTPKAAGRRLARSFYRVRQCWPVRPADVGPKSPPTAGNNYTVRNRAGTKRANVFRRNVRFVRPQFGLTPMVQWEGGGSGWKAFTPTSIWRRPRRRSPDRELYGDVDFRVRFSSP